MTFVFWNTEGSSTLNSCLGAQQSLWMPTVMHCDNCVRLFPVTDQDIHHEAWSVSITMQSHTADVKNKSCYICFTLGTSGHPPCSPYFALLDCHLSGPLQHLRGCWFDSNEEMAVLEWMQMQEPDFTKTEFLNSCQGGTNASVWLGIILKTVIP
jgi:hypothetical protein